jgi:hypothetical protein
MSDQTNEQPKTGQDALTPDQLAEMKAKMLKHYEEQIPFLTQQATYEALLADIEEARARRMEMTLRLIQMSQSMGPDDKAEKPERKLKTE